MTYSGKNFSTSGSNPAAFEPLDDGNLLQVVKVDNGQLNSGGYYVALGAAVGSGSTVSVVNALSHGLQAGTIFVSKETGTANYGQSRRIESVTTNSITLSKALPQAPANGSLYSAYIPTVLRTTIDGEVSRDATLATQTSVSGSASSVTLLAANSSRRGCSVANDSAATLYLRCSSSAASTASYTVKLVTDAYWESPFNYTGAITGIWASATGAARITEYT